MSSSSILVTLAILALLFKVVKGFLSSKSSPPRPPGPKPLPIIGNLLDLPRKSPETVFAQWAEKWGDIMYVDLAGRPIYILNSYKDAVDIFEKQGAKSSGRPSFPMITDILGWDQYVVLSPYGEKLRTSRRLIHQFIGGQLNVVLKKFGQLEEAETYASCKRILRDPEHLQEHIRITAGAVILNMTYGLQVGEGKNEYLEMIEEAMQGFSISGVPGTFMVDIIPWLKYVPSWVPGTGWKQQAKRWRSLTIDTIHRPYEKVMNDVAAGTAGENFVTLNQDFATDGEREYVLKTTAASLYAGGADTSVSSVYSLFLAMTLYPDVQKRAQQELDAVVGTDRLPTFQDRDRLPYIRALASEVLRWMPVVPLLTRAATDDITCNGYIIPKGAIIQANIWKFLHDPKTYKNPEQFSPERFLKSEGHEPEADPRGASFGLGRRICPGLNIAEAGIFISCATYLAVFNISKAVVDGREVTPKAESLTGVINYPAPFQCSIKPRSAKAEALIMAA